VKVWNDEVYFLLLLLLEYLSFLLKISHVSLVVDDQAIVQSDYWNWLNRFVEDLEKKLLLNVYQHRIYLFLKFILFICLCDDCLSELFFV
jgi:hypothetical protein